VKALYLFVQGKTREDLLAAVALIQAEAGVSAAKAGLAPPHDPLVAVEKIFVSLEPIPGFDLKVEVAGPAGSFLKHIETESEARVWLRGTGSVCMYVCMCVCVCVCVYVCVCE
jgi:hypothetical protein